MPTTAPPRAPRLAEPAAQPMSAPAPTPAAVVPTSNAPAPAGSNDEREAGSMRREHTRVCDSRNPHGLAEIAEPCTLAGMHVETLGSGPRLVLVHGSVGNGAVTWSEQRPLAERFTLVVVDRPGYPPNSPLERIDFEEQADEIADLLEPGDHLVGHSYGGVISLLAAARKVPRSLTVCEPPAFGVARGHTAVEEFLARFPEAPGDPRGYLEFFLPLVGSESSRPPPIPSSSPPARTTPRSTRSATSSRSGSARSAPCYQAPVIRSRARPASTTFSPSSSRVRSSVLAEKLLEALVPTLVGRPPRSELVLLARVRVGAVLEP